LSDPDITHVKLALEKLDLLVVQDIFMTETAQMAGVVLPAATFAEKNGTFTNTERRVQRVRTAVKPPGQALPDWQLTCLIAEKMGARGFDYAGPQQIMAEIASLTPSYAGISYDRLEKSSLQWPCSSANHPGTRILHTSGFTRGKGRFVPLVYSPVHEIPDEQYPLMLTTGRSIYHYHTGTMTRKVSGLNHLLKHEFVDISPADSARLGINDGDRVTVSSRRGSVSARARVTDNVGEGLVFMTFHFAETATNILMDAKQIDPVAKIPPLKTAAVRLTRE
jgi:predicted molibdopterin-dependent oxidoreductase YjgC